MQLPTIPFITQRKLLSFSNIVKLDVYCRVNNLTENVEEYIVTNRFYSNLNYGCLQQVKPLQLSQRNYQIDERLKCS